MENLAQTENNALTLGSTATRPKVAVEKFSVCVPKTKLQEVSSLQG